MGAEVRPCWQYLGLGPAVSDVAGAARRVRLICDAYDLTDRGDVIQTVLWWQDRCRRGIESAAERGEPGMVRLRDSGVSGAVREAHRWVAAHGSALDRAL